MNTRLAVELSKLEVVEAVTALKAEVDALRPLPPETEQRIMQKFRLDWNYHSNSIEGNQLNYGETVAFLMHGLTAKGKPLKDHLDIRGHNKAIEFLMSLVKEDRGISEADIRGLHMMILVETYEVDALTPDGQPTKKMIRLGEYKRESNSVRTRTGEIHYYATPEETPARMQALMAWYRETKNNPDVHPLVLSALFHHEFTAIHPFDDGNGRMARLLSNLILMQSGYLPVVVKKEKKDDYYSGLSQADTNNFLPVVEYFTVLEKGSFTIYLRGAKGESIDEYSDIDKQIELLKLEIESEMEQTLWNVYRFFSQTIIPLFANIQDKSLQIDSLFESNNDFIIGIDRENIAILRYDNLLLRNAIPPVFIDAPPWEGLLKIKSLHYEKKWSQFRKSHTKVDITFSINISLGNIITISAAFPEVEHEIELFRYKNLTDEERVDFTRIVFAKIIEQIRSFQY